MAPSAADELVSALTAAETAAAGYPNTTAGAIADAIQGVAGALSGFVADTTAFISARSIEVLGAGRSAKEYAEVAFTLNRALYPAYDGLLRAEAAAWNLLKQSKTTIEVVKALRVAEANKPEPNELTLAVLRAAQA